MFCVFRGLQSLGQAGSIVFFYKKYNLLRMNSRLVLGLVGLVAISPCIFGPLILDYFQIEGGD
ncbi:MAG: hypothetical protein OXS32_11970 [Verrucomicrobiales bacterium]|nr:hypothetical protein [Verrucomicrobiales bacterium]